MIQRQSSFDALMSLDFQSLQSIDNLANLIQTGSSSSHIPEAGMKNADFGSLASLSRQNLAAAAAAAGGSTSDISSAARRLASAGRMESLLRSLSSNNVRGNNNNNNDGGGSNSNANFHNLLASMQGNGLGRTGSSSLFGNLSNSNSNNANASSAVSLANLLRQDSSTGLTALRMQDGLNQRNSSVDDFLSLVASGDIPHEDPNLLNVPLMHQQGNAQEAAVKFLAQQHLLQGSGNAALANALASRSFGSLTSSNSSGQFPTGGSVAALAMAQARAQSNQHLLSLAGSKRKLDHYGQGGNDDQGDSKR
jgi:hypothetical protein